jgi:hypothetical protein
MWFGYVYACSPVVGPQRYTIYTKDSAPPDRYERVWCVCVHLVPDGHYDDVRLSEAWNTQMRMRLERFLLKETQSTLLLDHVWPYLRVSANDFRLSGHLWDAMDDATRVALCEHWALPSTARLVCRPAFQGSHTLVVTDPQLLCEVGRLIPMSLMPGFVAHPQVAGYAVLPPRLRQQRIEELAQDAGVA